MKQMQMPSPYVLVTVLRGFSTRAGIHERPSRYWDHKASRPDSYGPLTCSEEAVFMKAGQQGPQLSVRVFLNHDLVTDCACVHKEMYSFSTRSRNTFSLWGWQSALGGLFVHDSWPLCTLQWPGPDRLAQEAVKMVTSPSPWQTWHTFIALCPSSNLECISWGVGPVWQTHVAAKTHTRSLSFCVYAEGYVCVQVCPRQRVWLAWTVAGLEFILLWFPHIYALRVVLQQSYFVAVWLLWLLLLKCDKNKHWLHF